MKVLSQQSIFGGQYQRIQWVSKFLKSPTTMGIYLPPQASNTSPLPVLYWLSGLTCTDENMMQKSGIQRLANHYGWVIVTPDTSPRGENVADAPDQYDLGQGAGFYVNATQTPWAEHYQMYDFITQELPVFIESEFPVTQERGIFGHSMGGMGALVIGLNQPHRFHSISAFSPICHPSQCPWGQIAFKTYLGEDKELWKRYDPYELLIHKHQVPEILIDQGLGDAFFPEQLLTEDFERLSKQKSLPITLRYHQGYDHSYYFIATFLEDHLEFHTQQLTKV